MGGVGCLQTPVSTNKQAVSRARSQQPQKQDSSSSVFACMQPVQKRRKPKYPTIKKPADSSVNEEPLPESESQPIARKLNDTPGHEQDDQYNTDDGRKREESNQAKVKNNRRKNINILQDKKIRKPTLGDLKIDDTMNESQTNIETGAASGNEEVVITTLNRVQQKSLRIGIHFQIDQLIERLPKDHRLLMTKKTRLEKWFDMISYGLDPELKHKVFKNMPKPNQKNQFMQCGVDPQYRGKLNEIKPFEFTNYARIGLKNFFVSKPEQFLMRLAKGPPPQYRWFAWTFLTSSLGFKVPGEYKKLIELGRQPENEECIGDIRKDIERTMPQIQYLEPESIGIKQLTNVLQAYSVKKPEVGYCQGMNFLAGFSLIMSGGNEKQAFWFLYSFLEESHQHIRFDGQFKFYQNGFPGCFQYMAVFDDLFQERLPALYNHFQDQGIYDVLWIFKWFMDCYLINFPMNLSIRVWDNILAYGTRFLLNVTLSILITLEHRLLDLTMEQIIKFFENFWFDRYDTVAADNDNRRQNSWDSQEPVQPEVLNVEEIIERAQSIYLPNERLKALFQKHKLRDPVPKRPKFVPKKESVKPIQQQTFIAGATVPLNAESNENLKDHERKITDEDVFVKAESDLSDIEVTQKGQDHSVRKTIRKSQVKPSSEDIQNIIQKVSQHEEAENERMIRSPQRVQFEADVDEEKADKSLSVNDSEFGSSNRPVSGNPTDNSNMRKRKKKKKKKLSSFQKDLEQSEFRGLSEALPITITRQQDGTNQQLNIELQIEDIQNENFTEFHQFGRQPSSEIQVDNPPYPHQQNSSEAENNNRPKNREKRINMPPLGKISINLITYEKQGKSQQRPASTMSKNAGQFPMNRHTNMDSFENTDSLYNESGRINEFVIDRESMTFKKIPSAAKLRDKHNQRGNNQAVNTAQPRRSHQTDGLSSNGNQDQIQEGTNGGSDEIQQKKSSDDTNVKGKKSGSGGGASQTINLASIQASMINDGINEENAKDDHKSIQTVQSENQTALGLRDPNNNQHFRIGNLSQSIKQQRNSQKIYSDQLQLMAERNRKSTQIRMDQERMRRAQIMRPQTQFIHYDKNVHKLNANEKFGGRHGQKGNLGNTDIFGSRGSNFKCGNNNDIIEEFDESQEDINDDFTSKTAAHQQRVALRMKKTGTNIMFPRDTNRARCKNQTQSSEFGSDSEYGLNKSQRHQAENEDGQESQVNAHDQFDKESLQYLSQVVSEENIIHLNARPKNQYRIINQQSGRAQKTKDKGEQNLQVPATPQHNLKENQKLAQGAVVVAIKPTIQPCQSSPEKVLLPKNEQTDREQMDAAKDSRSNIEEMSLAGADREAQSIKIRKIKNHDQKCLGKNSNMKDDRKFDYQAALQQSAVHNMNIDHDIMESIRSDLMQESVAFSVDPTQDVNQINAELKITHSVSGIQRNKIAGPEMHHNHGGSFKFRHRDALPNKDLKIIELYKKDSKQFNEFLKKVQKNNFGQKSQPTSTRLHEKINSTPLRADLQQPESINHQIIDETSIDDQNGENNPGQELKVQESPQKNQTLNMEEENIIILTEDSQMNLGKQLAQLNGDNVKSYEQTNSKDPVIMDVDEYLTLEQAKRRQQTEEKKHIQVEFDKVD